MDAREKKRTMILENAVKVFSQEGFEGTDVEEIARLSNVGKGTVYRYFGNKEQLFIESFLYTVKTFRDEMEDVLKSDLPLGDKVEKLLEQLINRLQEKEQLLRLYTLDMAKVARIMGKKGPLISAKKFSRMEILINFIRNEQKKGNVVDTISAESIASMILGSTQQVMGLYYIGYIKDFSEVSKRIREIVHFVKKVIIKEDV